jgi:Tfp pilus assembly protein PilN
MRPVNLLPPKHRPHQPTGGKSGSSYLVLGVLALFLAAVVVYVLESNKITEAKSDIAAAEQKTADAKAKSQQMGPFANFAQIKEQRVASVRQLADGRFDWERTMRELAHLLPTGVWLQDVDASVSPVGAEATGGEQSTWAGPSIRLHGCAQKQPQVAVMMVRLREMQGVNDVKLTDSTRGEDPANGQAAPAQSDSSQAGIEGCGQHDSRANYEFNAVVEFDQVQPAPGKDDGKTPVRLGGGS